MHSAFIIIIMDVPFLILVHSSLFKFIFVLNSVIFWKLFVLAFLFGASENFPCSVPVLLVKIVLLDALQLLMLFVRMLACLKTKLFLFYHNDVNNNNS